MRNIPDAGLHEFQKVGELLGFPTAVDTSRPNIRGRATSVDGSVPGFPIYRAFKVCRNCHRSYEGQSFVPQYDDDEAQGGWCGSCIERIEAARRREFLEEDAKTYRDIRAKARRGRHTSDAGEGAPARRPRNVWQD